MYANEEVAKIAQELKENEGLRKSMDASFDLTPEELQLVTRIVKAKLDLAEKDCSSEHILVV